MAMGRGSAVWFCAVVAVFSTVVLQGVSGITYTVGDASGWSIMDYTPWLTGKTFRPADILVFTYITPNHDLVEVNKSDYDTCTKVSPIASYTEGNNEIVLGPTDTTRYFICSLPGHCTAGMKIAIPVTLATASSPSPAAAPVATTPTTSTPPVSSIAPTPGTIMMPPSPTPTAVPTPIAAPTLAPTPSILPPSPSMAPGTSPVTAPSTGTPMASPLAPTTPVTSSPAVSSPPAPPPAGSDEGSNSAPSFSPLALLFLSVFSFFLL